ncbi:putative WD repeat-containing protein C3H5.08c [Fusarium oxysporum f. sp. albedinis]|nr:putative WD repeat-containing protein C3H5.08c [Fusarium oxysporum f. sp. albedinis]
MAKKDKKDLPKTAQQDKKARQELNTASYNPRNHAFSRQNDERNNEPPIVSYHAYMSRCFLQSRLNSAPILQRRSRNYPQS